MDEIGKNSNNAFNDTEWTKTDPQYFRNNLTTAYTKFRASTLANPNPATSLRKVNIITPIYISNLGDYDKSGTLWRIALFPVGGYVKFRGDEDLSGKKDLSSVVDDSENFHSKSVWQKIATTAAGPVFNFILATFIFASIFIFRGETIVEPYVGQVVSESAASKAGIKKGDFIVSINELTEALSVSVKNLPKFLIPSVSSRFSNKDNKTSSSPSLTGSKGLYATVRLLLFPNEE